MAILDPKTRIMDSYITQEGRRQIGSGKLKAEFYSFTDSGAFYSLSDMFASGSNIADESIGTRFCFESTNQAQDSVTFEADDSGKLHVKELRNINSSSIRVINGQLFSGSIQSTLVPMTASEEFSSMAKDLLASSIDNFKNLYILGSPDLFDENRNEFKLAPTSLKFTITDNKPISSQENGGVQEASLDHIESLFADKRLTHIPNFQFMPPVNKPRMGSNKATPMGLFAEIGQRPIFDYIDLLAELQVAESQGFVQDISFSETSKANAIIGQFFEVAGNSVTKLDVIDFGVFSVQGQELTEVDKRRAEDEGRQLHTKHVFFVGKVFVDSYGSDTFVNIFTLILE